MIVRRLGLLAVLAAGFFLFAPSAHAQACSSPDGCYQNLDDGFTGWESLEPTGYKPPTINTCTALAGTGQSCKECAPVYYDNGMPKGYYVCAYVEHNASCKCISGGTAFCSGEGSCSYLYR